MPMSKEEFQESIKTLLEDINDPNSELAEMEASLAEVYEDVLPHDPHLAKLCLNVQNGIREIVSYVKSRNQ